MADVMTDNQQAQLVAFCVAIQEDAGTYFKYHGAGNQQFRLAMASLANHIERHGLKVVYVRLADLQADGTFAHFFTIKELAKDALYFEYHDGSVDPDIVVNRTHDALYQHQFFEQGAWSTYNHPGIVRFGNKGYALEQFGSLMPATLQVNDQRAQADEIRQFLARLPAGAIAKPLRLNGGRDIYRVQQIADIELMASDFLLQEFIETSGGVDGLASGRHDVRVYVIDSRPLLLSVRQPRPGDFLANTARGGSIRFLPIDDLPADLISTMDSVIDKVRHICYDYFISIDFFRSADRWFLIEINDQPGLPAGSMSIVSDDLNRHFLQSIIQREAYDYRSN